MNELERRERRAELVVKITLGTYEAVEPYEWELLQFFKDGYVTAEEVFELLEESRRKKYRKR